MILSQLTRLFKPSDREIQAHAIYLALVAQARQPGFYTELGVADSIDGRFDLITLHVFLLWHAASLKRDAALESLMQDLMDRMIADLDQSLREIGVGDVGVPKKMQKMAHALNGRLKTYDAAFDDAAAFEAALWRNVYRSDEMKREQAAALQDYARRAHERLVASDAQAMARAELNWPPIGH